METPPPEPVIRRTTRSALVEIPVRMGALSVSDNIRPSPNERHSVFGLTHLNIETGLPAGYVSPSPSPDELVMQARGRRRLPVSWSPDIDKSYPAQGNHDRTPVKLPATSGSTPIKSGGTPVKSGTCSIVLRSTPRKRLLLNDPADTSLSPISQGGSPSIKRIKVERLMGPLTEPIEVAIRALSNEQLVGVIQGIILKHPEIEEEMKATLPAPDIRPLQERLHDLKRNIFKSLPTSRLTSKTDSPAYSRASTHVIAFKKCVVEQGRALVNSCQWGSVVEYAMSAWAEVKSTPLWDNPPHNTARRQAFKSLAAHLMCALKRGSWSTDQIDDIYCKVKSFAQDSEDIKSCLKQLDSMRMKK